MASQSQDFEQSGYLRLCLGLGAVVVTAAVAVPAGARARRGLGQFGTPTAFRRAETDSQWSLQTGRWYSCGSSLAEWEFADPNKQVFALLASVMRMVAWVFLANGLLVHGVMSFGTYFLHSHPEHAFLDIFGEFAEMFDYVFFALFLRQASRDIDLVVRYKGDNITNLMRGISALVAFFKRLVVVSILLFCKGVASTGSHLSHLAALKTSGTPVQVNTSREGLLPWLQWCMPLIYSLLTVLLIMLGFKDLRDEEKKIVARMRRLERG